MIDFVEALKGRTIVEVEIDKDYPHTLILQLSDGKKYEITSDTSDYLYLVQVE